MRWSNYRWTADISLLTGISSAAWTHVRQWSIYSSVRAIVPHCTTVGTATMTLHSKPAWNVRLWSRQWTSWCSCILLFDVGENPETTSMYLWTIITKLYSLVRETSRAKKECDCIAITIAQRFGCIADLSSTIIIAHLLEKVNTFCNIFLLWGVVPEMYIILRTQRLLLFWKKKVILLYFFNNYTYSIYVHLNFNYFAILRVLSPIVLSRIWSFRLICADA